MPENNPALFFKLYGVRKPRTSYYERDFLDYVLMVLVSALAVGLSYGFGHVLSLVWLVLSAFTIATFIVRHGVAWNVPLIVRRPQDVLYMFVYKLRNLTPVWAFALGLLLLENILIAKTPNLPHHVDFMRKLAL